MSERQHVEDVEKLAGKHVQAGGTEGGACLNRHVSRWTRDNSCSHRWQAYERALEDRGRYDWPRYEALAREGGKVKTAVGRDRKGQLFPPWYQEELDAPQVVRKGRREAGSWDLEHGDNFRLKCYRPYWHEANHIIPNSTLQKAIAELAKGMHSPGRVRLVVRGRLLEAGYNLNHKSNMILLPMDAEVARALRLPRHRQTAFLRSHRAYSGNVEKELQLLFSKLKREIQKHLNPRPDYKYYKEDIDDLSMHLYKQIVAAGEVDGAGTLDEMDPKRFERQPQVQPPPKQGMSNGDF
jgi:hypothetical protein